MSIKYAILGLLHYREMHGYRIKEHIEENFGYMWSVNYGQIYPNLKQLEAEGFVTRRDVPQRSVPDRKLYSLTENGREEFTRWLFSPPERGMLIRDPFLLRFVFFDFGDPEKSLKLIDDQIVLYEEQKEKRQKKMLRWEGHDIHVRLMAELGLSLNEMMIGWLYRAKELISVQSDEAKVEEAVIRAD